MSGKAGSNRGILMVIAACLVILVVLVVGRELAVWNAVRKLEQEQQVQEAREAAKSAVEQEKAEDARQAQSLRTATGLDFARARLDELDAIYHAVMAAAPELDADVTNARARQRIGELAAQAKGVKTTGASCIGTVAGKLDALLHAASVTLEGMGLSMVEKASQQYQQSSQRCRAEIETELQKLNN